MSDYTAQQKERWEKILALARRFGCACRDDGSYEALSPERKAERQQAIVVAAQEMEIDPTDVSDDMARIIAMRVGQLVPLTAEEEHELFLQAAIAEVRRAYDYGVEIGQAVRIEGEGYLIFTDEVLAGMDTGLAAEVRACMAARRPLPLGEQAGQAN